MHLGGLHRRVPQFFVSSSKQSQKQPSQSGASELLHGRDTGAGHISAKGSKHAGDETSKDKDTLHQGRGGGANAANRPPGAPLPRSTSGGDSVHTLSRARSGPASPEPSMRMHNRMSNPDHLTRSRSEDLKGMMEFKIGGIYPVIPGKLYFTSQRFGAPTLQQLRGSSSQVFISCDLPKQYYPFCGDFGPNNLGIVHRFCQFMRTKMKASKNGDVQLIFRASEDVRIRTNAVFLLAAYLLVELGYSPEEAFDPFERMRPYPFKNYRDATYAPIEYELSALDCLRGLQKAIQKNWYCPASFDLEDYEHWDHPDNGDFHQVTPRFIAFKGPCNEGSVAEDYCHPGSYYIKPFKEKGVTAVIRLNEPNTYDPDAFIQAGINHYDLYFHDCTTPSDAIVNQFMQIVDSEPGIVAVHCKAGLGRTGTLIAIHMMRRFGFTARESIAWLRLSRPGSVIGPQQQYLEEYEARMHDSRSSSPVWSPSSPKVLRLGRKSSSRASTVTEHLQSSHEDGEQSELAKELAEQVSMASNRRAQGIHVAPHSTGLHSDPDLASALDRATTLGGGGGSFRFRG